MISGEEILSWLFIFMFLKIGSSSTKNTSGEAGIRELEHPGSVPDS